MIFTSGEHLQVGDIIQFPYEEETVFHTVEEENGNFLVLALQNGVRKIMFLEKYLEDLTWQVFQEIFMQEQYLAANEN